LAQERARKTKNPAPHGRTVALESARHSFAGRVDLVELALASSFEGDSASDVETHIARAPEFGACRLNLPFSADMPRRHPDDERRPTRRKSMALWLAGLKTGSSRKSKKAPKIFGASHYIKLD
jgi:hypothetical protein